ncbi:hypothetical protein IJS77_03500, partial [bacterium]|nr:hypothetical protein [bacterium]
MSLKINPKFYVNFKSTDNIHTKNVATKSQKNVNMDLVARLQAVSDINRMNIMKEIFELGLSSEELEKRVQKEYLSPITLLKEDAAEFNNLEEGDKKALVHLTKAANILNDVYLKQDNPKNIPFKNYLISQSQNGNKDAQNALILFNAQNGMSAIDRQSNMITLCKGNSPKDGKGVYPQDLDPKEFHEILIKMLENGKVEEVKKILSQRSVVVRSKDGLTSLDYTEIYSKEFNEAAQELELAAKVSTNADFNEFLKL